MPEYFRDQNQDQFDFTIPPGWDSRFKRPRIPSNVDIRGIEYPLPVYTPPDPETLFEDGVYAGPTYPLPMDPGTNAPRVTDEILALGRQHLGNPVPGRHGSFPLTKRTLDNRNNFLPQWAKPGWSNELQGREMTPLPNPTPNLEGVDITDMFRNRMGGW